MSSMSNMALPVREKRRVAMADIKIPEMFEKRPPRKDRLDECRAHYRETGRLERLPVIDGDNNLLDGYANYLIAKENGFDSILVAVDDGRPVDTIIVEVGGVQKTVTYARKMRDELDSGSLEPGAEIAAVFDGKVCRAVVVCTGTARRLDTLDAGRAIGRWHKSDRRRGKPKDKPDKNTGPQA